MRDCSTERLLFEDIQGKKIEAEFDGGQVTSDAGVLLRLLRRVLLSADPRLRGPDREAHHHDPAAGELRVCSSA